MSHKRVHARLATRDGRRLEGCGGGAVRWNLAAVEINAKGRSRFSGHQVTFGTAPIRIEAVFVHWGCVPRFALGRRHEAKAGLSRFGIHV
jgi:hypothetical protein